MFRYDPLCEVLDPVESVIWLAKLQIAQRKDMYAFVFLC